MNATGVALSALGRRDEAIAAYDRGLAIARASGNQRLIDFMLGNLGGGLIGAKDYERAVTILLEVLDRKPDAYLAAFRNTQVATALGHLRRFDQALGFATESVRLTREIKQTDFLDDRLETRGWILDNLGRADEPAWAASPSGRPLASLPAAGRELSAIRAIGPPGRVTTLDGLHATAPELQRALETQVPSVLHFATHGIVSDDAKEPSFLALSPGSGGEADGRLTADQVYRLDLSTDLVVLSACRTGAGPVTGDGVVGLTRAFFAAGSASVVASFWEVADEPTSLLMQRFYRRYAKTAAKSRSLREAQLALLADLRAGRAEVVSRGRRAALPEHPLLWAGFFLSGQR